MKRCKYTWNKCSFVEDFGKCYMNDLERINAYTCKYLKNPRNNVKRWDELKDGDVIRISFYDDGYRCNYVGIVYNLRLHYIDIWPGLGEKIYQDLGRLDEMYSIESIEKLSGEEEMKIREKFEQVKNRKNKQIKQLTMFDKLGGIDNEY